MNTKTLTIFLKTLKETILALFLRHLYTPALSKEKQAYLYLTEHTSPSTSPTTEQKQESSTDGIADSEDIEAVDRQIKMLVVRISNLSSKRDKAKSLVEYFGYKEQIRNARINLYIALDTYIKLERKYGFPVNFEYRHAFKRLTE